MAPIIVLTIMLDARRSSAGARLVAWTGAALFAGSLGYFLYSYLVRFGVSEASSGPDVTVLRSALANLALFSVFAMHHSVAARTPVKALLTRMVPPGLERSIYTWTASLLFIAVCALWQSVPGELYHLAGPAALPGYLLQLAGVLLTIRSSARLDVLDLAGVRQVLDANTTAGRRHVPLETSGPYRFVRHPLYFAWALLVLAAPHMTWTRLSFALISCSYLAIAIPLEERSLIHTFGADYRAYQRQVRWRMIPGLY
jgi:protein-S-isoprenylcysteine O-methyltransferase Ste14